MGQLIPFANNARTHSDEQIAEIAASIREFGWTNPILVDGDSGVIAGHGRLLAARKLGLESVPVIRLGHLSETQRRALVLTDNRIALSGGWDEELLQIELGALRDLDFDLDLIGFDEDELDRYLGAFDAEDGLVDEDLIPEVPDAPVSVAGDLWLLEHHRVLCGDATVLADVERVLDGRLADMVFTDPPYNVDYTGGAAGKPDRRIKNDNLGEEFYRFLYDACVNILTVTKGSTYICMSSSELHTLQKAFKEAGGHWSTFVIW
ncbi:MAG: ParB N-terminal domain-containing protein, partial [Rhodospirillales bacterium]|nr:ParB N-terminal domain-containing protein [Rhodospirillales bacterium]